jgi:hypothetical protein
MAPQDPGPPPDADFRDAFGEGLNDALDLDAWRPGVDLAAEYRRIEAEVRAAVRYETDLQKRVRDRVFPALSRAEGAPKGAGKYEVPVAEIEATQRGLLFPGAVEACDGSSQTHDTLALTIHQLAVGLVSYAGDQGTWQQRLYRRDLRLGRPDPAAEVLEVLERRGRREGLHAADHDRLSELAGRALMTWAERAFLLHRATAEWRMGHGSPAPLELLGGGGYADLVVRSVRLIREYVERRPKFVFVASEPTARHLLTIGQALRPLEYAVVETLRDRVQPYLDNLRRTTAPTIDTCWDGERLTPEQWLWRFRDRLAPRVVVGVYRATLLAPPQVFYAHEDHVHVAARIALADSALQEQRGFPLLLDMADRLCRQCAGGGSLAELADAAYLAAGAPFRYRSERANRPR